MSRPIRFVSPKRRRLPEGQRFLRSDGKPNFSTRVYEKPGELYLIAKKPVVTITQVEPVGKAVKTMTGKGFRRLPVTTATGELKGIITATDIVNYFGGGEFFNIIINRHGGNIYKALEEPVSSIMNKNPIYATVNDNLAYAIELMVKYNVGGLPVVTPDDMRVYGIITERDIINYLGGKEVGVKVRDVMTRNVITLPYDVSIGEAAKTMIKMGFRRIPLIDREGYVKGLITARSIVRFFGTNKVFEYVITGKIEEALSAPAFEAAIQNIVIVSPEEDVGDAATKMSNAGTGSALVIEDSKLVGIITERDIMMLLVIKR